MKGEQDEKKERKKKGKKMKERNRLIHTYKAGMYQASLQLFIPLSAEDRCTQAWQFNASNCVYILYFIITLIDK